MHSLLTKVDKPTPAMTRECANIHAGFMKFAPPLIHRFEQATIGLWTSKGGKAEGGKCKAQKVSGVACL